MIHLIIGRCHIRRRILPPLVRLCMKLKYCMVVLSPLLINHNHNFNVLPRDLKTEAVHCRGQGQGQDQESSRPRPRPQNFVLELSSRSRPVLEDPIPAESNTQIYAAYSIYITVTRLVRFKLM